MPDSLEQIFENYTSIKDESKSVRLNFFQNQLTALNNFAKFDDPKELGYYTKLSLEHLATLIEKGQFSKTIDQADSYINTLESSKIIDKQKELYFEFLFIKSISLYHLRNYKVAKPILERLVKEDSENENYRKWLKFTSFGHHFGLINIATTIIMLALILVLVFKNSISNIWIRIAVLSIPTLSLTSILIYEAYLKRRIKKNK